jgi:hypothetical protein
MPGHPEPPAFPTFGTAEDYNTAYPHAQIGAREDNRDVVAYVERHGTDDLTEQDFDGFALWFLPGGPPRDEPDRVGAVVASSRARPAGPYVVLVDGVSLRAAWHALLRERPPTLSAVAELLRQLNTPFEG